MNTQIMSLAERDELINEWELIEDDVWQHEHGWVIEHVPTGYELLFGNDWDESYGVFTELADAMVFMVTLETGELWIVAEQVDWQTEGF